MSDNWTANKIHHLLRIHNVNVDSTYRVSPASCVSQSFHQSTDRVIRRRSPLAKIDIRHTMSNNMYICLAKIYLSGEKYLSKISQNHLKAEWLDLLVPVVENLPALKVHHGVNLSSKMCNLWFFHFSCFHLVNVSSKMCNCDFSF